MKPINFPGMTATVAPTYRYLALPIHRDATDPSGCVTTCWEPTFMERIKILFGYPIWVQMLTFNKGITPIKVAIDNPLETPTDYLYE